MIKRIKQILITTMAAFTIIAPLAIVPVAHAESFDLEGNLCSGTDGDLLTSSGSECVDDTAAGDQVNSTVTLALNLFSAVVVS
jgi:hypothetical protein